MQVVSCARRRPGIRQRHEQLVVVAARNGVGEGRSRCTGRSPRRTVAPTTLASVSLARSSANPSDTSIMEVAPQAASTAASPTGHGPEVRGDGGATLGIPVAAVTREPQPGRRAAQRAGDEQEVADLRARAPDGAPGRDLADRRDGDRDLPTASEIPSHEPQRIFVARLPHARDQLHRPCGVRVGGEGQGDERRSRARRHRREVAQCHHHRPVADLARGRARAVEVRALHHRIDREHELPRPGATTAASSPTPTRTSGPVPESTLRMASSTARSPMFIPSWPSSDAVAAWTNDVTAGRGRVCRSVDFHRTPTRPLGHRRTHDPR